jgi:actin, other eukaryote
MLILPAIISLHPLDNRQSESFVGMASSDNAPKSVVIDLGCAYTKCGLSDIELTAKVIPTVWSQHEESCYYGDEAVTYRKIHPLKDICNRDYIEHWDAAENYLQHLWQKEIKAETSTYSVYFGARFLDKKGYREKLLEYFLEELRVPGFYASSTGLLNLYGSGRSSGSVLDSGAYNSTVTVSQDGLLNEYQEINLPLGGRDIDHRIKTLVDPQVEDREFIQNIKCNKCRLEVTPKIKLPLPDAVPVVPVAPVAPMEPEETMIESPANYTLPDGSVVQIKQELINLPEILLFPNKIGLRRPGLQDMLYESILKSDYEHRGELLANLVACGGNFMIPGLQGKMHELLAAMIPSNLRAKFDDIENPQILGWTGGTIVASLNSFQSNWITKQMLLEQGPSVILRKCL